MDTPLGGLHHLTAVTGHAADNVAFYTGVLGLRLVKKTVNQDDVSAYHLFYGDEVGSPGTEVTFFDWPNSGAHRVGTGTIAETALRVPSGALDWWTGRFAERGVAHDGVAEREGRATLTFTDSEGQRLSLVDDGDAPGKVPWSGSAVPAETQIRGLHSVTLDVAALAPTAQVLTEVLGFRQAGTYPHPTDADGRVDVFETGPGGPGAAVRVAERPSLGRGRGGGRVGIGGVHHVAFRVPDDAAHRAWQERIAAAGLGVTPVIDRFYFRSLYFRELGGILFEIATDGPGFATDEDPTHLGERLALPPFLEPRRAEIEAGLTPIEAVGGRR